MDKDLVFLKECTNEQLQVLSDLLVYKPNGHRRTSVSLSSTRNYDLYYPNEMHLLLEDVTNELLLQGGNKVRNFLRGGKGVSYHKLLIDICNKQKVNFNPHNTVEQLEKYLLQKTIETAIEDMTEEDVHQISSELSKKDLSNIVSSGFRLTSPIILKTTTMVMAQILRKLGLKIVAGALGRFIGTRLFSILTGPVGWVLGGLWTAYDLLGPSYKVTVPCVMTIAYFRATINLTEESFNE